MNKVFIGLLLCVAAPSLCSQSQQTLSDFIIKYGNKEKPTLFVLLSENECVSCIRELQYLKDYKDIEYFHITVLVYTRDKDIGHTLSNAIGLPVTDFYNAAPFLTFNSKSTPLIFSCNQSHEVTAYRKWNNGLTQQEFETIFIQALYADVVF